jgi:hypothetical protein
VLTARVEQRVGTEVEAAEQRISALEATRAWSREHDLAYDQVAEQTPLLLAVDLGLVGAVVAVVPRMNYRAQRRRRR